MKIEFNKTKFEKLSDEIDNLIKDSVALFNSDCSVSHPNNRKLQRLENILLQHLLENTNFSNVFDFLKSEFVTIGDHTILFHILCELKKSNKNTLNDFLIALNNYVKNIKQKPVNDYSFYVPIRLNLYIPKNQISTLKKKTKQSNGVNIVKPTKKLLSKISGNNLKSLFGNRNFLIRIDSSGRDTRYCTKIVNKKIDAFLGAFALARFAYIDTSKLISASRDLSIETNPLEDFFIVIENQNTVIYPSGQSALLIENQIKPETISKINKPPWNVHISRRYVNYPLVIQILDGFRRSSNDIHKILEKALGLYYEAITEKDLDMSFLKFWVVSEIILRYSGKRKGKDLISLLEKIIIDKHLRKTVDLLYYKRNKLVHEFDTGYISQPNRNLSKMISEELIMLLLDPPFKIKNKEELKIFLSSLSSKQHLIKQRSIINSIIRKMK
ncbi:MAG: hypothetical protein J4469_01125 [Candidatus Aenigmarchaeota archaeon]|nr:hypothetical protein [Candidatus Aenigmarchaeota archaeon]